ncbi:hypothetical protein OG2516_04983 [Oceanicola granulosus HTCC2516]|uniref:Activator of Hsp90 ATPase homologue 1/2-like C-terminal domain-containing protein n=1 Tax=Oceanicola granulosus (strain ATCC BAA-861 / DSM 15982 / KCTC 12143 / HTCC2516) TaxID=314256 RepID=Q2CBZ1_OCEGH|nr:SRPBCC domain-containing protein [Oceanicola granulosus]EAR50203.1 hypothetical protein OG2516_04983 [Oceanicola granulosus HTCC2516]
MQPITKSLTVPLPPAEAFRLFTEGLASWWPVERHSRSAGQGARPAALEVEPGEGGRIVETTADGRRAVWGEITRWDEGRALGVDWRLGDDEDSAAAPTRLLVLFAPVPEGTRVDLTHGGFTRRAANETCGPALAAA